MVADAQVSDSQSGFKPASMPSRTPAYAARRAAADNDEPAFTPGCSRRGGLPDAQYASRHRPGRRRGGGLAGTVPATCRWSRPGRRTPPRRPYSCRSRTPASRRVLAATGALSPSGRVHRASSDHWFVAIDLGGYARPHQCQCRGRTSTTGLLAGGALAKPNLKVAVREPMPPIGETLGGRTWDVFMSHASEDMSSCARPLFDALVDLGISAKR